jgi:chorismate synthase
MMMLFNKDQQSEAYNDIKNMFRPGHADYTYFKKYGIRDYRGGGRSSGRETSGRVAAGAIAKKLLQARGVKVTAYTLKAAGISCNETDLSVIEKNPLRACDMKAAALMEEKINILISEGNSAGGIIECRINGVIPGLGEPVFDKLDALLAHAMLSLGAVKGIEFGVGFGCADMTGKEHNDQMDKNGFVTNNAGGIIGGITSGEEIVFRIAVKPTSSISMSQKTVDIDGIEKDIRTEGRHDPCICPRIVPVVEAMACLVLEDQYKLLSALKE